MHDVDLLSEILRRACSTAAVPPVSVLQLLRTVRAGELAGAVEKAGTGGRHLSAVSSPENRERHFALGDIFASQGKASSFRQEDFSSSL